MPDAYRQLREITSSLEKHYRDMQDFEFTIENGKLFMLQTRNGKRTGAAALRVAVEMTKEGLIDKKEAVLRVAPQQLDQLLHPLFDQASLKALTKIANGIDASPGAAVGRAVFTADEAVESAKKSPVILIRKETTPDDIHGMEVAKGVLTAVGGKSSHAAVVARGMGLALRSRGGRAAHRRAQETVHGEGGRQGHRRQRGRLDFVRWNHGRRLSRPSQNQGARSPIAVVRRVYEMGRRVSRRLRSAGECRHPARCQSCSRVWRRGHRPVPHRAHVLRGRSHPVHAGHDSGRRPQDARQGAAEAASDAARGFRRAV